MTTQQTANKPSKTSNATAVDSEASTETSDERDPRSWLELYGDYLHRYALSLTGNVDEAQEVVQDTLVAGIRALDSFEGRGSIKGWLRGILKNKVIDRIRARKHRDTVPLDSELTGEPDYFNKLGIWRGIVEKWDTDPEQVIEQRDFLAALRGCLDKLPDRMRMALLMKNLDGVSTEEVCDTLEVSSANLWVLIHRARLRLRECLNRSWFSHRS